MSRTIAYFLFFCLLSTNILCEDLNHYFLTAAKSVPRIGRSPGKSSNSDFEKFFLKASKSVPRIGRENNMPFAFNHELWDTPNKYPEWTDIANLYEYQPDLVPMNEWYQDIAGNDLPFGGRFKRDVPVKFKRNYK